MIVIKNAKGMQFDPPKILDNVDVVIDDGTIVDVGNGVAAGYKAEKVIDRKW